MDSQAITKIPINKQQDDKRRKGLHEIEMKIGEEMQALEELLGLN